MKLLKLLFAAILFIQLGCLVVLQLQGHKINWAAVAVIFPAVFGYACLRLWMGSNKPAIS